MKKIILFILALIVFYIVSIFAFPSVTSSIAEKFWFSEFNKNVINFRNELNDFITNFDLIWKFKQTKDQAIEIKQNVETSVQDTKQKIETIQTNVDKTAKAIDETTKAVNNTVDSLNELQKSIWDVVPETGTWN